VNKQEVRERVWDAIQASGAARFPGVRGRIPNFVGAEAASRLLATTEAWAAAHTLKANPDSPQLPVRVAALEAGKVVYIAVPRLKSAKPFLELDPDQLMVKPRAAASITGSATHGRPTRIEELPHIDLVVCGSVAVNAYGARVGKGGGYSDLELALAIEAGAIDDRTTIATTVHPVQVLDEDLPETEHDFRVDLIVTPDEIVHTRGGNRQQGILWDHLDEEKQREVVVLATRSRP
jgi:5-formyltetrahydrofolate cyclo-ligase